PRLRGKPKPRRALSYSCGHPRPGYRAVIGVKRALCAVRLRERRNGLECASRRVESPENITLVTHPYNCAVLAFENVRAAEQFVHFQPPPLHRASQTGVPTRFGWDANDRSRERRRPRAYAGRSL